jgi:hypothetical protein
MPVLFGMTENTIYNQLFAALIAYVMLKWLYKLTKAAYLSANIIEGCFSVNASDRDTAAGMAGAMSLFLHDHFVCCRSSLSNFC